MSKMIAIGLNFSGVLLPIVDGEDGFQRVPLKPICDVIGILWENQRNKVQGGYLARRLGVATPLMGGGVSMVCIRIDRVASFLSTINPDRVRANGNIDSADWLEAKHQEWDDVLHAWESGHRVEVQGKLTAALRRAGVIARVASISDPVLRRIALLEIGINPDLLRPPAEGNQGDLFAAAS